MKNAERKNNKCPQQSKQVHNMQHGVNYGSITTRGNEIAESILNLINSNENNMIAYSSWKFYYILLKRKLPHKLSLKIKKHETIRNYECRVSKNKTN